MRPSRASLSRQRVTAFAMTHPPSNLALRVGTAIVAVPVILALVYPAPPWAFYLLVLAASLVGVRELFVMTHPGDSFAQAVGIVTSAAASLTVYLFSGDARALITVLLVVPAIGPLTTLARLGAIETAALRASALGFGPLFIVVPLTLLAVMKKTLGDAGPGFVLLTLGLAWLADTVAYFAGRLFGQRKLYEAVSPKKTIEGAIGGLLGSVAWAVLGSVWYLRGSLPLLHAFPLALVAGALGQVGDLAESLLKRSTGVKDSGAIVPGHGGVLDRVDAVIMTSMVVFLYALWR
jgi:phosphatidate cytidylyltransferase